MGSHLTFNYLRYKLLYPFCRTSIRRWEGKNLALDLTSWTHSGSNSHTTIFPPSRLPFHHRFIPYRVGEQICPQELWEQKVQRAKPEYQPIANICQTHFLEEREGKSQTHLTQEPLSWCSLWVCMVTSSGPCFRAGPLTGLPSRKFTSFSLATGRVVPQGVSLIFPGRSWQTETWHSELSCPPDSFPNSRSRIICLEK